MLTHLYTRLRVSLGAMLLVDLLERQDKGLEALSEDLWRIINKPTESELHKTAAFLDYLELLQPEEYIEYDPGRIHGELEMLLRDITLLLQKYQRFQQRPRALHLQHPNILILEYPCHPGSPKRITYAPRRPRVIRPV